MASVVFDCLFWLFVFLRFATVALTAQALGAGDAQEHRTTLIRALLLAAAIGLALIALQVPLSSAFFGSWARAPKSRTRPSPISTSASGRRRSCSPTRSCSAG